MEELTPARRTRKQRYALMLAHKAAASALEASLKDEMADSFEREGARETWDLPGLGLVVGAVTQDSVEITDKDALVDWLNTYYPHQVHEVHRKEVINPGWLANVLLPALVPMDEEGGEPGGSPGARALLVDNKIGTIVPGVRWTRGGNLAGVSVRPDSDTRRRLNLAAADYAIGAAQMPGLPSGESSD